MTTAFNPKATLRAIIAGAAICGIGACGAPTQPSGGAAGKADYADRDDDLQTEIGLMTNDGTLSAGDVEELFRDHTGNRVSVAEMLTIRDALEKIGAFASSTYTVEPAAFERALELARVANLFDNEKAIVSAASKSYGGSEIPPAVRELVARARLNGAIAYDVSSGGFELITSGEEAGNVDWTNKFTPYQPKSPPRDLPGRQTDPAYYVASGVDASGEPTGYVQIQAANVAPPAPRWNMGFDYTEITPVVLATDALDTTTEYNVMDRTECAANCDGAGDERVMQWTYRVERGGNGRVEQHYDHDSHPDPFARAPRGRSGPTTARSSPTARCTASPPRGGSRPPTGVRRAAS